MTQTAAHTKTVVETEKQMLKVSTSRFGEIEVTEDRVIFMTTPFLGFPESNRFLLRAHAENSPFMWLQSLDNPSLAFVVIRSIVIRPDYQPSLPAAIRREIQIEAEDQVEILLILTIPQGTPEKMTANLLGPVVININKHLAKQVLLDPNQYDPCWPVFQED